MAASSLREAAGALCLARDAAAQDQETARRIFYGRAHDRLHELARLTEVADRPAAGRLLEAKGAVEGDLDRPTPSARLTADFGRLIRATSNALGVLSIASPTCAG